MAKLTKRAKLIRDKIDVDRVYEPAEALALVREVASAKFNESVDVAINLGVDPRKSDQVVRGSTVLPNGTGKTMRVAVFAQGEQAEKARAAGADQVGFEDLAESIKQGNLDFDIVVATPDSMRVVGALGTILGPRGLMPNPKVGTVAADVEQAVKNAKAGQIQFRTDKAGIVHCPIGKTDFQPEALAENLQSLVAELIKAKPSAAKGVYLGKASVSSTMGPGVAIDLASFS